MSRNKQYRIKKIRQSPFVAVGSFASPELSLFDTMVLYNLSYRYHLMSLHNRAAQAFTLKSGFALYRGFAHTLYPTYMHQIMVAINENPRPSVLEMSRWYDFGWLGIPFIWLYKKVL